jgi:medium-chain acyl-[acyl-carrier-protein] hydrolase
MTRSLLSRPTPTHGTPAERDPWLVRPETRPTARIRLFCFTYAGGGASIYRPWTRELPPEVELCAIQLPGRESRLLEEPYAEMTALVDQLSAALDPYLDLPFAFFGHSMGALVAFEMAREIRGRRGLSPVHLFVSGHAAPQIRRRRAPVHQLPDAAFVEAIRRLNGTPEQVLENAELMAIVLPALRADLALCETYTYVSAAPLSCPISAFGGLADSEVGYDDLRAWQAETTGPFRLRLFPGDHFYLRDERTALLDSIGQTLRQRIDRPARLTVGV